MLTVLLSRCLQLYDRKFSGVMRIDGMHAIGLNTSHSARQVSASVSLLTASFCQRSLETFSTTSDSPVHSRGVRKVTKELIIFNA
jgi:hypothetical protein